LQVQAEDDDPPLWDRLFPEASRDRSSAIGDTDLPPHMPLFPRAQPSCLKRGTFSARRHGGAPSAGRGTPAVVVLVQAPQQADPTSKRKAGVVTASSGSGPGSGSVCFEPDVEEARLSGARWQE